MQFFFKLFLLHSFLCSMIEGESFVDIRLIVDHHCFNLLFIRSEANESDTFIGTNLYLRIMIMLYVQYNGIFIPEWLFLITNDNFIYINICRLYLLVQIYHAFYNQSKTDVYDYSFIIPFPYFLPFLGVVLKDSAMKENLNFIKYRMIYGILVFILHSFYLSNCIDWINFVVYGNWSRYSFSGIWLM